MLQSGRPGVMMDEFDGFLGKVALITGAGRSPGREIALAFAMLGGVVAANDINPVSLDETLNMLHQAGGEARGYVFDIARRMPIEAMVAQVVDHFGRIDVLVNATSVTPDELLLEMDEWEFHRTLDVNLGGPYFCIQQVGRVMQKQGGGVVVNVISTSGDKTIPSGKSAYIASQAGLVGLTACVAHELSAHHIRLNAVYTPSGMLEFFDLPGWDENAYYKWKQALPVELPGTHKALVSLVLFLCSCAADSVTGMIVSSSV